jgi:hypothetical protein
MMTYDEAKLEVLALVPKIGTRYLWKKQFGDWTIPHYLVRLVGFRQGGWIFLKGDVDFVGSSLSNESGRVTLSMSEYWERLGDGRLTKLHDIR